MQNEITLLDIAFKDLTSSQLLFEKELYPQSIFYIQQAVEKSIKQLGIYNQVVKPSELHKKIGHKTEKIFKRVVGQVKHITGDSDEDINLSYNQ
ncbi:MAG: HEPN domain-containing protein [Candidatus Aminicenantes bacterium]|nr:HEPN domain-containing protein [Candidatus Aminicenantes bacterium]